MAEALATKYAASVDAIQTALTPFFQQLRKEDLICHVDVRTPRGPLQLAGVGSTLPLGPHRLRPIATCKAFSCWTRCMKSAKRAGPAPRPAPRKHEGDC